MTRTPKEAAEGRLNLLVGGDADVFEACRPLLACFAENITHVGAVGAGHGMKLLHNYVSLGIGRADRRSGGLRAAQRRRAPTSSSTCWPRAAAAAPRCERIRPYLLAGDTSGLRFSIANACKDLGYYNTMASDAGAHLAIAAAVLETLEQAQAQAAPGALMPELSALLARR